MPDQDFPFSSHQLDAPAYDISVIAQISILDSNIVLCIGASYLQLEGIYRNEFSVEGNSATFTYGLLKTTLF